VIVDQGKKALRTSLPLPGAKGKEGWLGHRHRTSKEGEKNESASLRAPRKKGSTFRLSLSGQRECATSSTVPGGPHPPHSSFAKREGKKGAGSGGNQRGKKEKGAGTAEQTSDGGRKRSVRESRLGPRKKEKKREKEGPFSRAVVVAYLGKKG